MNAFDDAMAAEQRQQATHLNAWRQKADEKDRKATQLLKDFADSIGRRGVPTTEYLIWPLDPDKTSPYAQRPRPGDRLSGTPLILEGWPVQSCSWHGTHHAVGVDGQAIYFMNEDSSYSREVVRALGREVVLGVSKFLWTKPVTQYGTPKMPRYRGVVVRAGGFFDDLAIAGDKFLMDAAHRLLRGETPARHCFGWD